MNTSEYTPVDVQNLYPHTSFLYHPKDVSNSGLLLLLREGLLLNERPYSALRNIAKLNSSSATILGIILATVVAAQVLGLR